jgi:hypothetical protein
MRCNAYGKTDKKASLTVSLKTLATCMYGHYEGGLNPHNRCNLTLPLFKSAEERCGVKDKDKQGLGDTGKSLSLTEQCTGASA